ncbi:MAG: hypothetical protein KDE58_39535, partial [Caldilineaceae bacterium]|nr:hypothetical protein [Caldilineaceae bacterium]
KICDRIIILANGRTALAGIPGEIFAQADYLRTLGLDVPVATQIFVELASRGVIAYSEDSSIHNAVYTTEQAIRQLTQLFQRDPAHVNSDPNDNPNEVT